MSIERRVKEYIEERYNPDYPEILPEHELEKELGLDSLDRVELVIKFEEEEHIHIPDLEFDEIVTVKDFVELINNRIKKEHPTKRAEGSGVTIGEILEHKINN